jgi:hypothetical protein
MAQWALVECVVAKTVVEPAKLLRVSGLIAAAFLVFCVPSLRSKYVQRRWIVGR